MPKISSRTFPIALIVSAIIYMFVGSIALAIAMSAVDRGAASLMRGLHQIFFSESDLLVLLAYWMGMRLGAKHLSTWVVPVLLAVLASVLTIFVAPFLVSIFVSRARSLQVDLNINTVNYLIWYEGGPFVLALWFAACVVWLVSRINGVYLIPRHMDRNEVKQEAERKTNWAVFGLSSAVIVAIHYCLYLMSYIDFSRLLVATSAILIWFGMASMVSHGLRRFSWFGLLCLAVGMVLPVSFWSWLTMGRAPLYMIAMVCAVTMSWSMFKWLLFAWALNLCGYRLVAYRHDAFASDDHNEVGRHRSVDKMESESPIREWII